MARIDGKMEVNVTGGVEKKLVLIVSAGRTGTNHLQRLLRRIPNVSARGEPFNPGAAWGLNDTDITHLATWSGNAFVDRHDAQLKGLLVSKPRECLEQMLEVLPPGKPILIVKVLTEQLSAEQVESIATSGFLASCVFVRRRVIDSFASHTKAHLVSAWHSRDTTRLQPNLIMDDFKAHLERHQRWHTQVSGVLRRNQIPFGVMNYETDIDCDEGECVRKFALVAGEHLFEPAGRTGSKGRLKQDWGDRIDDKVANWEEFAAELRQSGLFDAAMSPLNI